MLEQVKVVLCLLEGFAFSLVVKVVEMALGLYLCRMEMLLESECRLVLVIQVRMEGLLLRRRVVVLCRLRRLCKGCSATGAR